jgi:Sialic acid synthase
MSIFITAEIGINHNGDIDLAKELISRSKEAGADAVKFQKRTIDLVYTQDALNAKRESPWGTTNREQKIGLEFEKKEFDIISNHCKDEKIEWFASAWDIESQKFLNQYNCKYNKIASAMLTNTNLINEIVKEQKHTFISTGMHTLEEIDEVVDIFVRENCKFELMHTVSTYPMKIEDANLRMIETLRKRI